MSIRIPTLKTALLVISIVPTMIHCVGAQEAAADLHAKKQSGSQSSSKKQAAARTGQPGMTASAAEINQGKALYKAYDCAACHSIAGKGCRDGVPLDGVGRRRTVGFLTEHLKDPEEHVSRNKKAFGGDPTNLMPPTDLDGRELTLVVKYLKTLR